MVQEPLWESKSDERSLGTDVAEEHGGYPHIGLIPRHETVGKGKETLLRASLEESEGLRNSGLYPYEL